jgi:hypothetical protein
MDAPLFAGGGYLLSLCPRDAPYSEFNLTVRKLSPAFNYSWQAALCELADDLSGFEPSASIERVKISGCGKSRWRTSMSQLQLQICIRWVMMSAWP